MTTMSIQGPALIHETPADEPDIGQFGHRQTMFVYMNQVPDAEQLEAAKATHAYADAILSNGLHQVGFSSMPGGSGAWQLLAMSPDDAAHYPVGAEVTFHSRKDKEIGFGTVVAITPGPAEPAPAPGV